MQYCNKLFFLIFLVLCSTVVFGQKKDPRGADFDSNNPFGGNRGGKGKSFDSLQIGKDPSLPDTTIFDSFTLLDINTLSPFADTTLDRSLSFSDAARDPRAPMANLGTVASASHTLMYNPVRSTAFHSGHHEYERFNYTVDKFRYFKTNRAISDLYFSSVANQQNLTIKTDFTRNYADGIQLSINYQRFSNVGFYDTQRARSTNLGMGVWYQSPKDKYNFFLTYVSNVNTEQQNGGITTEDLYGTDFAQFRTAIPTFLDGASTRHQQRAVRASNYYRLNPSDSSSWDLKIQYDLEYKWNYWNYDDPVTNLGTDTIHYQSYLTDHRGNRSYVRDNSLEQSVYLHGIGKNGYQGKVGLQYANHKINHSVVDSTINDLSLVFALDIPVAQALNIQTDGSFGLGANAGSFDLGGKIAINVGDWASLQGKARFYRRSVELNETTYWINDRRVFNNDFTKPFGSILQGGLHIPKLKTAFTLRQVLENNPIVWGSDALPSQYDGLYSSTQLGADIHLSLGGFHTENYIRYQILSDDIIDLPKFISTHRLYWDGKIFKSNMNFRTGFQARIVPEYTQQRFFPATGKFYEGTQPRLSYPDIDYFVSFKVQSFRMFLQLQNIANFWIGDDQINFQVQDHPQFDWKIRYGIRWVLFD